MIENFLDCITQSVLLQNSKIIDIITLYFINLFKILWDYSIVILELFLLYIIISQIHYITYKDKKEQKIFTWKEFILGIFKLLKIIILYTFVCYLLTFINVNEYLDDSIFKYVFLGLVIILVIIIKLKNLKNFKDYLKLHMLNVISLIILRGILIFLLPSYLSKYLSLNLMYILFPELFLLLKYIIIKLFENSIYTFKNKFSDMWTYKTNIDDIIKNFHNKFIVNHMYVPVHLDAIKKLWESVLIYIAKLVLEDKIKLNLMERPTSSSSSSESRDFN